jgi:hypothetical protein
LTCRSEFGVTFRAHSAETITMSPASLTPAEVAAMRRQAAAEVLAAAAAHSLLTDQLHDLEARRRDNWSPEESAQHRELRTRIDEARRHHDDAHRRLRAISAFRPYAALTQVGRGPAGLSRATSRFA